MKEVNKSKLGYFALGLILGVVAFTFLLGDNADEYRLFTAYFEVLEENTEKPVNAGVSIHPIEWDLMGVGTMPYYIELKENGPYRATYVDYAMSNCEIHISADGYQSRTVPKSMIEEIAGKTSKAVTNFKPTTIYLKKVDPVGAINSEAAASPR